MNSVIVVGAGLAGLVAADELRRRRIPVTVLEARDRIGGRVWTPGDGFEAGAEFVDEGQDAIRELVERLGLRLQPILKSGFGEAERTSSGVRIHPRVRWDRYLQKLQPLVDAYRRADERWDGPVARAIARRSVAEFAGRGGMVWLRGLLGADVDEISLLVLVELAAASEAPPGRQDFYRIRGGSDRLIERLAAPLKDGIHLRRRVTAISQTSRGLRVTVDGDTLSADHVIVTIPAVLLEDVAFRPALPETQRKAFRRLRYGRMTKTRLEFDRPFWRKTGRPHAYATPFPIGAVWEGSKRGSMMMLAGGSASDATQKLLKQGGPERLRAELGWLGSRSARLLACHSVSWEHDPWSRGAYAYFDPAYDPALRPWLARPFGRVLFAGEHTSLQWQGFMNGAVDSGLRAAAEVLAMRNRLPTSERS